MEQKNIAILKCPFPDFRILLKSNIYKSVLD